MSRIEYKWERGDAGRLVWRLLEYRPEKTVAQTKMLAVEIVNWCGLG